MKKPLIQTGRGILYVVSTPIGNLEDITLRALNILGEVDLIAAESVQHSKILCSHYGIKTKLTSYNQHNQSSKGPKLVAKLLNGCHIALISPLGLLSKKPLVVPVDQSLLRVRQLAKAIDKYLA